MIVRMLAAKAARANKYDGAERLREIFLGLVFRVSCGPTILNARQSLTKSLPGK